MSRIVHGARRNCVNADKNSRHTNPWLAVAGAAAAGLACLFFLCFDFHSRSLISPLRQALFPNGFAAAAMALVFMQCLVSRAAAPGAVDTPRRAALDLFLVSFLILFLELTLIRWIPAYAKLVSYFTNFILIACFLGMGLGCLAASWRISFLGATPGLVAAVMLGTLFVYDSAPAVQHAAALAGGDRIYFGAEEGGGSWAAGVPYIIGGLFVLITAAFMGPGQVMGRLFNAFDKPLKAYIVNIGASAAGITAFTLLAYMQTPAWIWFACSGALLCALMLPRMRLAAAAAPALLLVLCAAAAFFADASQSGSVTWSPYYRVKLDENRISVNQISHQAMSSSRTPPFIYQYHLPWLLNRDTGGAPPQDVLIIGAGSGTDVSHALRYGAAHVDAVEIDPAILAIGRAHHPNNPYADPRVCIINTDGRSFLQTTDKQYDLIIYGLVDSVTLMSSFSSVRLENYLFTEQAFEDVKKRLKPGGRFVVYNFFRRSWLTIRIYRVMEKVFDDPPLLVLVPSAQAIHPDMQHDTRMISLFMAGNTAPLHQAFGARGAYRVVQNQGVADQPFNGFAPPPGVATRDLYSTAVSGGEDMRLTTDDWPFIYLREARIPRHNLVGLGIILLVSLAAVLAFSSAGRGASGFSLHFFALGGAFMLLETTSIVRLSLLYGSTWIVNSVVFLCVLLMIFAANFYVLRRGARGASVPYLLLLAALALNLALPLAWFLDKGFFTGRVLSAAMTFLPIAFAGVVFAGSFARSRRPAADLGSNLLGIIAGGALEYASLVWGYNALLAAAALLYALSWIAAPRYNNS